MGEPAGRLQAGLLSAPAEAGVRDWAVTLLGRVDRALPGPGGGDGAGLHDFRVALRRLRTWLRAFAPYTSVSDKLRAQLKDLDLTTNHGRDAEVALNWLKGQRPRMNGARLVGVDWFGAALEREREQAYAALAALPRSWRGLHVKLQKSLARQGIGPRRRETFAAAAGRHIVEHAKELSELAERVQSPTDIGAAHQCRIAAKRLRYLLEPLSDQVTDANGAVAGLAALQDRLGELHDASVLLYRLIDATETAAMDEAKAHLRLILCGDVDEDRLDGLAACSAQCGLLVLALRARHREAALFNQALQELHSRRMYLLGEHLHLIGELLYRAGH